MSPKAVGNLHILLTSLQCLTIHLLDIVTSSVLSAGPPHTQYIPGWVFLSNIKNDLIKQLFKD